MEKHNSEKQNEERKRESTFGNKNSQKTLPPLIYDFGSRIDKISYRYRRFRRAADKSGYRVPALNPVLLFVQRSRLELHS